MILATRLALITSLLTMMPAVAAAQEPKPQAQDDAAFQAAKRHFEDGVRLMREGRREHDPSKIENAYLEFKAAYAVYPNTTSGLLNLIESELATNRYVDAMRHLRAYVRTNGAPAETSDYHKIFVEQWNIAFKATGHIDIDAPSNYRVTIDGKDDVGLSPFTEPVDVAPGQHVIDAKGPASLNATIEAPAGAIVKAKLAAPMSPAISDRTHAPAPDATRHDTPPIQEEPSFWTTKRTWGVVLAGVGVAAAATGFVFVAKNQDDADQASSLNTSLGAYACAGASVSAQCQQLSSARDDQRRDATLAVTFLGLGAAAVVAGGVLFFLPQRRSSTPTSIAPLLAPRMGGLQLTGGF